MMTSCASVLNSSSQTITLRSKKDAQFIYLGDTLTSTGSKTKITVARSAQPIQLQAIIDSVPEEIEIKPVNSTAYYSNIFFNYGIGMLYDMNKPKRYSYPSPVWVDYNSKEARFTEKGSVLLHLGMPYVNFFRFSPEGEPRKDKSGFLGLSLGLDYNYAENSFISVKAESALDFPIPFPAPYDIFGEYETLMSYGFSMSNNHRFHRFSFGYGLSAHRNAWALRNTDRIENGQRVSSLTKYRSMLGFTFDGYVRVAGPFYCGLSYKPYLLDISNKAATGYEHVISFELVWKLRVWNVYN